jgi:predicted  nucleic acid-binding Zn-ribbon protein
MQLTEQQMREQFWAATAEQEKLEAALKPQHEAYDVLSQQETDLRLKRQALSAEIKRAERPIIELQRRRAELSRFLGGKVGPNTAA